MNDIQQRRVTRLLKNPMLVLIEPRNICMDGIQSRTTLNIDAAAHVSRLISSSIEREHLVQDD